MFLFQQELQSARYKDLFGDPQVAHTFCIIVFRVNNVSFDSWARLLQGAKMHLLSFRSKVHYKLGKVHFTFLYGAQPCPFLCDRFPPITKHWPCIMSCQICRSTLNHALNQNIKTPCSWIFFDTMYLCTLECDNTKPIIKYFFHIMSCKINRFALNHTPGKNTIFQIGKLHE